MSREVRTVEQDPAGTSQSPECPTCRIGEAVINPLAGIIKIFAFRTGAGSQFVLRVSYYGYGSIERVLTIPS